MARHLAIGDMHGCFNALKALANYVAFRSDDVIITLGDYVNRGPDSRLVLDYLLELEATNELVPLRGNHDIMMAAARNDAKSYERWLDYGGKATLRSYGPFDGDPSALDNVPQDHWDFMANRLVSYYESDQHFFVHANAQPNVPLAQQSDEWLYWTSFDDPPRHESGKIMVCGHTSQKSGVPIANGNAICIDTWAYGRGWLTCLHVESGRIWQANEEGERRSLHLEDIDTSAMK